MSDDKDNVVTFKGNQANDDDTYACGHSKHEQYVLVCTECDNRTFNLFAGGKITCAFCDTEIKIAEDDDIRKWREVVARPSPKDDIAPSNHADKVMSQNHMSDPSYASRFVASVINKWVDKQELVMLVGYKDTGEGRHWFDIRTEEQREWVLEKLTQLHDGLKEMDISMPLHQTIIPSEQVMVAQDGDEDT